MNSILQKILLLLFFVFCQIQLKSQNFVVSSIGYYNVENLFDTKDDKGVNDKDFTPFGKNSWNSIKYSNKIANISEVISKISIDVNPDGLAILGLSEVENKGVIEDLVSHANIIEKNYQIVHYDSPDKRGIDVALIYQKKYFNLQSSKNYVLNHPTDSSFRTRSQLLVSGDLLGERVHIIVAHWPSRSGGEKRSKPNRIAAANLGRSIIDSIQLAEPNAKIIYMGDLNDDPTNESLTKHLKSNGNLQKLKPSQMYNPMLDLYKKGIGSLAWRDTWNIFDQILFTPSLVKNQKGFTFYKAKVFNSSFLIQKQGSYKGYPFRTFAGGNYIGGYSDHFPVYTFLIKQFK